MNSNSCICSRCNLVQFSPFGTARDSLCIWCQKQYGIAVYPPSDLEPYVNIASRSKKWVLLTFSDVAQTKWRNMQRYLIEIIENTSRPQRCRKCDVSYLCQHITQIAYEKFRWVRKELNIFAKRQKLHFAIQQELVHLGYIFEIESTLLVLD